MGGDGLFVARCCIRQALVLVHDSYLLGNAVHLTVEAVQIWSLASVVHRMSYVLQRAASTWSR